MPKAKKTKSGNYHCKVVDRYEYRDGKRKVIFRSFTAPTKNECERLAADFQCQKEERVKNMSVDQAIDRYIVSRSNVLAPYTIRGYRSLQEHAYEMIGQKKIKDLQSEDLQLWLNDFKEKHSPKTCRNAYSLLTATIKQFRPSTRFTVSMPQACPPELYTPTDADIKKLLEHIKDTELEKAVLLSAFGTLRRGEVCAITYDDIHGDEIRINKELVRVKGTGWIVKTTKTPESIRTVKYPRTVIERLLRDRGKSERVVNLCPDTITKRHRAALKACGLPLFRFHDLRAYAVSIRHAIGIPDVYIMQDGGYKTDTIMKQIYRRSMSDKRKEFSDKTAAHFEALLCAK